MNRSVVLKNMARKAGLCDEWFNDWKDDCTADELINKYKRGIDFSLSKDWLHNDTIKQLFSEEELHCNGVFVGGNGFINGSGTFVINDKSYILGVFKDFQVSEIYVRQGSKLDLSVEDNAIVKVRIFDNSSVNIVNNSTNKVFVYSYGENNITTNGNVLIRKNKNIYTE